MMPTPARRALGVRAVKHYPNRVYFVSSVPPRPAEAVSATSVGWSSLTFPPPLAPFRTEGLPATRQPNSAGNATTACRRFGRRAVHGGGAPGRPSRASCGCTCSRRPRSATDHRIARITSSLHGPQTLYWYGEGVGVRGRRLFARLQASTADRGLPSPDARDRSGPRRRNEARFTPLRRGRTPSPRMLRNLRR